MEEIITRANCSADNNTLNIRASSHFLFIMSASAAGNWLVEPTQRMVGGEARHLGTWQGLAVRITPRGSLLKEEKMTA